MKVRFKEKPYLTYEDLKNRDPIYYFSKKFGLPEDYIQEIYRLCEVDFRFSKQGIRRAYREYQEIADYIAKLWRISFKPRQIKYMHNVIRRHFRLMEMLKRGGKIAGTYRDIILRRS